MSRILSGNRLVQDLLHIEKLKRKIVIPTCGEGLIGVAGGVSQQAKLE